MLPNSTFPHIFCPNPPIIMCPFPRVLDFNDRIFPWFDISKILYFAIFSRTSCVLCVLMPIFPKLYFPRVIFSLSSMFPKHLCSMVPLCPEVYIPKALCFLSPVFLGLIVPEPYSQGSLSSGTYVSQILALDSKFIYDSRSYFGSYSRPCNPNSGIFVLYIYIHPRNTLYPLYFKGVQGVP